jgi:hypothetical protein
MWHHPMNANELGSSLTDATASTDHVTASVNDRGMVLFDAASHQIFTSNRLGARIWCALAQGKSLDDIVSEISAEYGVPNATVRNDARRFLAELHRHGLMRLEPTL